MYRIVLLWLSVLAVSQATGEERVIPDFDPDIGEEIMEICAGCHGVYAQGTPDGEYPRLAGLNPAYLEHEIKLFKTRKRINIPMIPYANDRELPPDDVKNITAYVASIRLPRHMSKLDKTKEFDPLARLEESKKVTNIPHYPGDPEAGGKLYRQECASCHGRKGEGKWKKQVPMLTGQHSNYLLRQVEKIRKGKRFHDSEDDAELFRSYTNEEIANILAWLSYQDD
ncbi:c-type cytochrome [Thiolapillus brandeum]|uniref:Cytochrome c, class I n=1 Tax=Thiolapillus brandeum TaxID=1076588 RepID=A0A7U6GH99_9GAMM|nr:c-type cytochrome [Thiolapillus brandeum]BAO43559.1 cytochrome c, class I [Thiolapillus brandeum]